MSRRVKESFAVSFLVLCSLLVLYFPRVFAYFKLNLHAILRITTYLSKVETREVSRRQNVWAGDTGIRDTACPRALLACTPPLITSETNMTDAVTVQ